MHQVILKRHHDNPILKCSDVPYPSTCVFNAGVTKWQGQYVMVFRNDYGQWGAAHLDGTNLGLATSDDGLHWQVAPKPVFEWHTDEVIRAYDPRLTVIEDKLFMCFAVDTRHGVLGGIATTSDFETWKILCTTTPDNRNMVLFPEKIAGDFVRLERPMPVYSRGRDRFDIWQSRSSDLKRWGDHQLIAGVECFPFANDKIGPGAPPIKTKQGWLCVVHCVDRDESRGKNGWENTWKKRYCAGLMLLDLENPSIVKGIMREPLLVPEKPYELEEGFRTNTIFPTAAILEPTGEVKVYYGAADTVMAVASASVDDLLFACTPVK
jgi:beta-1,4-mannooligosaccharide/beta-1,4-mannosyl-N-acetylglucosamine phosphorylase